MGGGYKHAREDLDHAWIKNRENRVQDGHTETLRVLVEELGADVTKKNNSGKTAVMMAAQVSLPKHVSVLVP
jgi:hypothetical protein